MGEREQENRKRKAAAKSFPVLVFINAFDKDYNTVHNKTKEWKKTGSGGS